MDPRALSPSDDAAHRRRVLAVVCVGSFMAPLDASIVNVALPSVAGHFGVGIAAVQWVVLAYLLTTSSLLLTAGRLGDLRGHKHVYVAGFVVFTLASALCGMAPSIWSLVAARAIQALGAAGMMSAGPAILTRTFPTLQRGRALGTVSLAVAAGLTAGPFLGGIITGGLGWRWIFLVNLPVGVAAAALASAVIREGEPDPSHRFDLAGAAAAFATLALLLLALSRGGSWGWASPTFLGTLLAAAGVFTIFLWAERRSPEPMLDLTLFRSRLFSAANVSALANYVGLFSVTFLTPFWLLGVWGETHRRVGLLLTAVPLATALVAPLSGALSDRIGSRFLSSLGLGVITTALLGLSLARPGHGLSLPAAILALVGFGSGLFQPPNTSAILGSVPRHRLGIASGMVATMRNVGMVLGVAMAGAIVATLAPAGTADPNLDAAIRAAYRAGALVTALGAAASLVRGREPGTALRTS